MNGKTQTSPEVVFLRALPETNYHHAIEKDLCIIWVMVAEVLNVL
jgi:hypothetical protein